MKNCFIILSHKQSMKNFGDGPISIEEFGDIHAVVLLFVAEMKTS